MNDTINVALEDKGFRDINPATCGYEKCEPEHSFGPAIRPYYLIHYVVSGKGILESGGERHQISAGQAFLIKPGQVTKYYTGRDEPWEYIWIGFSGSAAGRLDALEFPVFTAGAKLFRDMIQVREMEAMKEEFLAGKIFLLLAELFYKGGKSGNHAEIAANFITANYMHDLKLYDVAKAVGLDARYLSRIFKKKYEVTMQQYLMEVRMAEAALLLQKGYNVTETTFMVGYQDPFVFSKAFKKFYGCAPNFYGKQKPAHEKSSSGELPIFYD